MSTSATRRGSYFGIAMVVVLFAIMEVGCGNSNKSNGGTGTVGGTGTGAGTGGSGGTNSAASKQFLYVGNGTGTTAYLMNSDGSLAAVSGSPFSVGGSNLAADPNGKVLFSLGGTSPSNEAVSTDTINSDGSPTVASSVMDSSFSGGIAINPDGTTLYVDSISASQANPGWKIYSIASDGSLTFSNGVVNLNAGRLAFLPDGSFAYAPYCYHLAANIEGFSTANGTLTASNQTVPQIGSSSECPNAVAVTPSGSMLAAAWSDGDQVGPIDNLIAVYTIDPATHQITGVSGSPFPASGVGVDAVIDPSGKFLIVAQDNGVGVYQLGTNSLSEVAGSPFFSGTNFSRVMMSPSGAFVVGLSQKSQEIVVFNFNTSAGVLTTASGSPVSATNPTDLAIVQH